MIIILNALAVQVLLQKLASPQIFLRRDLLFPLKGCMGLGNKVCSRQSNGQAALFIDACLPPKLDNLIGKLRDPQNILVRFRRQAQHKVQFYVAPAPGKGRGTGGKDLFLPQIFIDHVTQPLGSCLRRKGKAAFPHRLNPLHQFPGEIICPERGDGNAVLVCLAIRNQPVCQLLQSLVVRSGQAGQGNFIISGAFQQLHSLIKQNSRALFPHRADAEPGLTETAPPDTPPKQLQISTVMNDFRRRNQHFGWKIGMIQILNDPLDHSFRSFPIGDHFRQVAFRIVYRRVEARHIYPRNLGNIPQETILRPALHLCAAIDVQNFHGAFLTLAQGEKVHKVRQRFRVKGTHASGKYHILQSRSLAAVQRYPGKAQHIQHIGICHLIADGKSDHVKILHRVLTLQRPKRNLFPPHDFFHIAPRGKYPLTPHILLRIHHTVKDPHSQVGHTDLISVREAECHANANILFFFLDLSPLSAGIPCRFLNGREKSLLSICHDFTSLAVLPFIVMPGEKICKLFFV